MGSIRKNIHLSLTTLLAIIFLQNSQSIHSFRNLVTNNEKTGKNNLFMFPHTQAVARSHEFTKENLMNVSRDISLLTISMRV